MCDLKESIQNNRSEKKIATDSDCPELVSNWHRKLIKLNCNRCRAKTKWGKKINLYNWKGNDANRLLLFRKSQV